MDRLRGLDALRGVAALIVLFYHVAAVYDLGSQPKGYLAVDFFFMLSGFVIARVLENGSRTPLQFMQWRYKRFWLTMAVGTTLGLCFMPGDHWQALPGLLLVPIFASKYVFPFNPPAWSIFFELFANAVHAFLRKFWPVAFVVSLCWLIASGGFGGGPNADNFVRGFARVLVAYSIGVMMFQRWGDSPPVTMPRYSGLLLLVLLLPIRSAWLDFSFVLLICPLVIMSAIRASLPFAAQLGALSFPLYAVHYPVLLAAKAAGVDPFLAAGIAIAVAAGVSVLTVQPLGRRRLNEVAAVRP